MAIVLAVVGVVSAVLAVLAEPDSTLASRLVVLFVPVFPISEPFCTPSVA